MTCWSAYMYQQNSEKSLWSNSQLPPPPGYANASICERAWKPFFFAFLQSKTAISFNILSVLQILCRYKLHAGRLTCTNKTQKNHYGAISNCPPPPRLRQCIYMRASLETFFFAFPQSKTAISFYILSVLQNFVGTNAGRLTCTDKTQN